MKIKPIRHKKTNTFQFIPFSERIAELNIDVFHHVTHQNEESSEEVETYFHQTLKKWNVLNLTDGYITFKKQVQDIITLPQLLHRKQYVIDKLIEYLKIRDILFLQPILELVVAVARDLQKEFYEYFPHFFPEIICLLNSKHAEQIEYAFTTLAYLFKFLWRYLVKHVKAVVTLLLPLLADTQPSYINRFAAEGFAFVVRKMRDKNSFFKLMLNILEDNTNGILGCAKLLFQVTAGTSGQFHSCAKEMLLLYFNALQDQSVNQTLVYEVVKEVIVCALQNIHPQKCDIMWNVLLNVIDTFVEQPSKIFERSNGLVLLLRLLHIIINYKNGRFLIDATPLIKKLMIMIDLYNNDDNILQEVINVSVAILLASNAKLMQETSSQLLLKIMAVNNTKILYYAVENLMYHVSFETLILPGILRRSISTGFDNEILFLLSKIITAKASPCLNGITLNKWRKYIIDVRGIGIESIDYFLLELKTLFTDVISLNAMRILIILPHLKPLHKNFEDILKNGLLCLYKKILRYDSIETTMDINKIAFIFVLTLDTVIHIFEPDNFHDFIINTDIKIVDLINKYRDNKYILNAVDLCLTYFAGSQYHTDYINPVVFELLNNSIAKKMSSCYSQVRLVAAHLYSLFTDVKELKQSIQNGRKTAMELVYLIECEPATIEKYRNKLLHLQALQFQSDAIINLDPKYYEFSLRCLIANLYINFSLLWEPLCAIIASYASKECTIFWSTFFEELTCFNMPEIEWKPLFDCPITSSLEASLEKHNDKPDFENHKLLLWKCMTHFPCYAEKKNRDLTGLFIEFVNTNFFNSNSEDGKSCNIGKHKALIDINKDMENESDGEEQNETFTNIEDSQINIKDRNYKVRLLIAQMEIFSKVGNPNMLYRETEMHQIYLDLLSSRNVDIQKVALSCLCAYKYKYLLPYKESLYGLINEKSFKNELARFKLDQESNSIQEEHRMGLMPIIMRIIYGKMITKIGIRTGGKAGGFARRKMILRFLNGTKESEMIIFIGMAFKPFKRHMLIETNETLDLQQHTMDIINAINLSKVMPPKRMQSAVNLLAIIIEEFGGKMLKKLLPVLLRILISILAEVTGILQKSEEIYPGYLPAMKTVKVNCISILVRFFTHFEDYDWKEDEIDALFNVAIFPWLQKLPIEGIHSPTILLKLFMTWGQNPRYYPLFVKHQENNKSISPLPYVIQLLLNPKAHQSVINAILEIIEKMLTLQNYGKSNEDIRETGRYLPFVPLTSVLTNLLEVEEKMLSNGVNYGSAVLLPHIPHILEFIKCELKKYNKNISRTELTILSRISEFVSDPETCNILLTLILPILNKKSLYGKNEETVIEFLTTVTNLVKIVNNPEIHIRSITPLLSHVFSIPARKLIIQLYSLIAEKSSAKHSEIMIRDCNILSSLNAWDPKWINQPDFQRRLEAFREISKMIEENEITLEFGVAIIHNCFYFLKNETDLATRDYSGQCLKLVGSKLANKYKNNTKDRRYLMDDTILAITRKGITSKNDVVKLQSIAFLGYMAIECANVHPILRDLSFLANKVDPEVDFFENMQHLQLHRQGRALLKFCALAKTLKRPMNVKTLTLFILPLCSSYLCNEAFIHKNSIVDAAIETIGMICKLLPWYHYEIVLKYYLNKLRSCIEFQKQIVRIVVTILDSFHYDLSKYKPTEEIVQNKFISIESKNSISLEYEEEINKTINEQGELEDIIQKAEEKFDETLNNDKLENTEEISGKNDLTIEESIPVVEKQLLLSQYGAKKIVFSISNIFLPQLHRIIIARSQRDISHKLNKKKITFENEEDELTRVPIALALVKLLQKLPENILNANLPGIFMKLCTFLKSRMESVRRVTRMMLQKIMITLGPKYLHYLLREMNTLLTKGFQVHVLAYTIQSVLVALKPYFQKFDINHNLQSILSVCKIDLFGLTAEEKEIVGIVKIVQEARSTKSFDIFHILAEFITESCLLDLILPLKEILMNTHSHKTIHKVTECLRNIILGLADNNYIPLEKMLIFLYGIISESIPHFISARETKKLTEEQIKDSARQKPDCFLILKEPKRMSIKTAAKTTKNTNAHVMVEFGLKLYHILLKRDKISDVKYKSYIEPIVPLLSDCINSQHVKLSTVALQCLNWILKMDLTSIHTLISDICAAMFTILHQYSAAGLSKGDNFDLVMATFKCISVIIRDVKYFNISTDQLKILILYAEQDLYDNDKQSIAFSLLKVIINRKMIIPEMHSVMEKVSILSITSELEHVRLQSRSVFYSYLMGYPLGKHLDKHISFYLVQLNYEMLSGRLSALEMMHTIITGFPLKALTIRSALIFVMMSTRLINDDDPTCRKLCAKCLKELITRISFNNRNKLFDIVFQWLSDPKITHRTLAAQLCGIFASIEKNEFELRLVKVLPVLLKQFHVDFSESNNVEFGKFVKLNQHTYDDKIKYPNLKDPEKVKDYHLFQVLQLLLKISEHCTRFLTSEKYIDSVRLFANYSQFLLGYPHIWVRLAAAQLIGFILATLDIDKTIKLLNNSQDDQLQQDGVYSKSVYTLKSLILDLVAQLYPDMTFEELADQVVKNLIFIVKILKSFEECTVKDKKRDNENKTNDLNVSLSWFIRRLRKVINVEITQAPKSISVRSAVFKCFAGIIATTSVEYLNTIVFNIMSPLVREITITEGSNIELRQLAKEVTVMIKKSIGIEEYATLLQRAQQKLDIKRMERRRISAQQFITDPELAAKRKIARQQKKKKRKKENRTL